MFYILLPLPFPHFADKSPNKGGASNGGGGIAQPNASNNQMQNGAAAAPVPLGVQSMITQTDRYGNAQKLQAPVS